MVRIIMAIIFLLFSGQNNFAQQTEGDATKILSYFPDGYYSVIESVENVNKGGGYIKHDIYKKYAERRFHDLVDSAPLPPSFKRYPLLILNGILADYAIRDEQNSSENDINQKKIIGKRRRSIPLNSERENGESASVELEDISNEVWIFQSHEFGKALTKEAKQGDLEVLTYKYEDLKLYSFLSNRIKYYACLDADEYLLVSSSEKILHAMVSAGRGVNSIVESEYHKEFTDAVCTIKGVWSYRSNASAVIMRKLISAKQLDVSDEYLDIMRDNNGRRRLHRYRYFEMEDNLLRRDVSIYGGESGAQEEYNKMVQLYNEQHKLLKDMNKRGAEEFITKIEGTSFSLDKKKFIMTEVWTKGFYRAITRIHN